MRIIFILILVLVIGALVYKFNVFQLFRDERSLSEEVSQIKDRLRKMTDENSALKAQIEYLSYPENLEKELRSRFNYKSAGEKFIILTPANDTQNATSTP